MPNIGRTAGGIVKKAVTSMMTAPTTGTNARRRRFMRPLETNTGANRENRQSR
jgi:gas vesicle protein